MKLAQALIAALFTMAYALCANAEDIIRVDTRTKAEDRQYNVTISAQNATSGDFGHAFITWNKEDDVKQMTTQQVAGFYPHGDSIEGIFLFQPGSLYDDTNHVADIKLIVTVDSRQYDESRKVYDTWKRDGRYSLGLSDCTTFAGQVSRSIGLFTPLRAFFPFPADYVREVSRIKQLRDENAARHRASDVDAHHQFDVVRSRPLPSSGAANGSGYNPPATNYTPSSPSGGPSGLPPSSSSSRPLFNAQPQQPPVSSPMQLPAGGQQQQPIVVPGQR